MFTSTNTTYWCNGGNVSNLLAGFWRTATLGVSARQRQKENRGYPRGPIGHDLGPKLLFINDFSKKVVCTGLIGEPFADSRKECYGRQ